jgi:hypothetical protein
MRDTGCRPAIVAFPVGAGKADLRFVSHGER